MIKMHKYSFIDAISVFLLFFCILSSVFPYITMFGNNAIICLACEVLWFILNIFQAPHAMNRTLSAYWYTIPYLLYVIFVPYVFGNSSIGNRYISIGIIVIGIYIFQYYSAINKLNVIGTAIKISIPFFIFTLFNTIKVAIASPWAVRQVYKVGYSKGSDALLLQGVGGYDFIYFLTLLVIIFYITMIKYHGKKGFLSCVFMVACLAAILFANLIIALIMCIVGIMIASIIHINGKSRIAFVLVSVMVLFIYFLHGDKIIEFVLGVFNNEGRVYEVLSSGSRSGSILTSLYDEFIGDRWSYIQISLKSMLQSPILGQVVYQSSLNTNVYTAISNHSYIFDTFALFGLLIGCVTVYIFLLTFKSYTVYKGGNKIYKNSMLLTGLILIIFNNISYSTAIGFSIIYPYLVFWLSEKGKQMKEEISNESQRR